MPLTLADKHVTDCVGTGTIDIFLCLLFLYISRVMLNNPMAAVLLTSARLAELYGEDIFPYRATPTVLLRKGHLQTWRENRKASVKERAFRSAGWRKPAGKWKGKALKFSNGWESPPNAPDHLSLWLSPQSGKPKLQTPPNDDDVSADEQSVENS